MKWISYNKFANIINKVEKFYSFAAADDDYQDGEGDLALNEAARNLDPSEYGEVIENSVNIGRLYNEVIKNQKGYQSLYQFITNFIEEMDDEFGDDDTLKETKDVLDLMQDELQSLMGGKVSKDSAEDSAWFFNQRKNIVTEQFATETPESIWSQVIGEDADGDPTIQQMFQGSGDKDGRGNIGIHTTKLRKEPNQAKDYANEKKRYEQNLNPVMLQPTVAEKIQNLTSILNQLIPIASKLEALEKQKLLETESVDPETESQIDSLSKQKDVLDKQRTTIKNSIYRDIKEYNVKEMTSKLDSVKDPRERFILQQKIELEQSRASRDRGKRKENRLRERLIGMFEAGNDPSPVETQKFLKNIEEAKALRIPIEQVRLEEAENVAKTKRTIKVPGKHNLYDWSGMDLAGYIQHIGQALLAERKTIKDKIVGTKNKTITPEDKAFFKPYLDAIANAATSGDKTALLNAVKELTAFRDKFVKQSRAFKQYIISVRSSKFLYQFRDRLKLLANWGIESKETFTQEEYNFIIDTIKYGNKVADFYASLEIPSISGEKPIATHYEKPAEKIRMACNYLTKLVGELDTTGVEGVESLEEKESATI